MMRVAPRDRGAGLTQLKFGVWCAFVGICRPVPPVRGRGCEPFRVSRRVFYLTPASGAGVCS